MISAPLRPVKAGYLRHITTHSEPSETFRADKFGSVASAAGDLEPFRVITTMKKEVLLREIGTTADLFTRLGAS